MVKNTKTITVTEEEKTVGCADDNSVSDGMSSARSSEGCALLLTICSLLEKKTDYFEYPEAVSMDEFDFVLDQISAEVDAGTRLKSFAHRLQYIDGRIIIREVPGPQHEIVSDAMKEIILRFNSGVRDPFFPTGSSRLRLNNNQASLEPDGGFALKAMMGNPGYYENGVPLSTVILEVQASEGFPSMDDTSQKHLRGAFTAVVINLYMHRDAAQPGPLGLPGGMVDQLYYVEYRKNGPPRADGGVNPSMVKSFGSCTTPGQLGALARAVRMSLNGLTLGVGNNTFVLDGTGACNAAGLPDFCVTIPGQVLWSSAPADLAPLHVTRGKQLTIDLFEVRSVLRESLYGL